MEVGLGIVKVYAVDSSGDCECSVAAFSDLAFSITAMVAAAIPSALLSFPSAPGCSTTSVASPANVCVLVLNSTGIGLPENIQGAVITQNITTGHSTSLVTTYGSPIAVGVPTTCTATVTDASIGGIPSLGLVTWTTDGAGSFIPVAVCTLSA